MGKIYSCFSSFKQNSLNHCFNSSNLHEKGYIWRVCPVHPPHLSSPTRYIWAPSDCALNVGESSLCRIWSSLHSRELIKRIKICELMKAFWPVFKTHFLQLILVINHYVQFVTDSGNLFVNICKFLCELLGILWKIRTIRKHYFLNRACSYIMS